MSQSNVINLGLLLLTAVMALTAIWARNDARKQGSAATQAADRANAIADEAKQLQEDALHHQRLTAPPAWSEVRLERQTRGSRAYKVFNNSGRTMELSEFHIECADGIVPRQPAQTLVVETGDFMEFGIIPYAGFSGGQLTIKWTYSDDEKSKPHSVKRTVPVN